MNSRSPTAAPHPAVYLVAIDGASTADHVLEVACGLGAALGGAAELHILRVVGGVASAGAMLTPALVTPTDMLEGGRLILDRTTAYAAGRFQGRIVGHLGAGDAWREIMQMASNLRADLIVVGTAGRTGIARMALGSVAEQVVRHAGCPVLVVRPKDYHARADKASSHRAAIASPSRTKPRARSCGANDIARSTRTVACTTSCRRRSRSAR